MSQSVVLNKIKQELTNINQKINDFGGDELMI